MQERELRTEFKKGIHDFKASNGYIENFMRRAVLQSSVRLVGLSGSSILYGHKERMNQIEEICSVYPLWDIYNMDESGFFYSLCPRISYLSSSENRRDD